MVGILLFNKYSLDGIKVEDMGLQRYVTLHPVIVPKTGARYATKRFYKSRINIVERLINRLMVTGHKGDKHFRTSGRNTGKATVSYRTVTEAFRIIEERTKQNPVAVFVKAVENAAPREEIVTIEYGGARYPKAVDCAPQRRVDFALKFFAQGTYDKCFNKKKSAPEALAEEILAAYRLDSKSTAVAKKYEIERQADSSR